MVPLLERVENSLQLMSPALAGESRAHNSCELVLQMN